MSLFNIRASIKRRSRGPVKEAFERGSTTLFDSRARFEPPECNDHWRVDFGLFKHGDVTGQSKAFASLQRCGNFVIVLHMIGHVDILGAGGMKLLQFDIMEWLLNRRHEMTSGLRYLLHGGVEDGDFGLADWRRYVRQCPMRLAYILPEEAKFPSDFTSRRYLELNPSVRAAGADARGHYLSHGIFHGFAYKRNDPSGP